MKLLNWGAVVAASLTFVAGMGSKSKTVSNVDEPKVLPESTRASAPSAVNTPVQLIENTAEDNKKIDDDLNAPAPVAETKPVVAKTPQNAKASVSQKKAASAKKIKAKTSKKSSKPTKKKS